VINVLPTVSSGGIVSETSNVSEKIHKQKQLLNTKEAAEFLRISISTLYKWVRQGKIECIKTGGRLKFKKEVLEAWLEKNTHKERRDIF
jgi:excisionase family DNA binding protein